MFVHSYAAGKHGRDPQLLAISPDGEIVYTLDLTKLSRSSLATCYVLRATAQASLIGYDVKSTLKVLLELGFTNLPPVVHDVLIGAFLINSLRREQTLTELAQADLGYEGKGFEELSPEEMAGSAPEIIAIIKRLHEQQTKAMASIPKITQLAQDIEWPVIPVLTRMEYEGIQLDTGYLKKFAVEINDTISDLEQQIYGFADQEFNIASPAQLADILFGKLNLSLPTAGIKKGKTSYSTAASELDKLRGSHPIIDLITQYREAVKLKNTYVDTLPEQVDEHSRVHTTFNLTIAQTGRLSSTDPNLQNIPVRTDLGRHIRTAFVAGPGKLLVSADYSQFELRLSAAMSDDKELIDMFNRDVDVHTATAAQVYGREPEDVTKQMRRVAKVVNFGILYGMSPHGLSVATGMTYEQAGHFIKQYMDFRKPLIGYLEKLKEQARKDGYVETLFGRRRPMPDIHSSNFAIRAAAERAAVNMPIQGTEADLMKLAMVRVEKALEAFSTETEVRSAESEDKILLTPHSALHTPASSARLLLQIHDSLIVEVPAKDAEAVAELLKTTMEAIYPELPVKLTIDTSIGQNWGEL